MKIGNRNFELEKLKKPVIMGILNVTPDSFSDGGKFNDLDRALKHTEEMLSQGADIIDIGGESTRPGAIKVTADDEIERVCPIIEKIKERFDTVISLDTYKPQTAKAGIEAGADIINDIMGLRYDVDSDSFLPRGKASLMAKVAAEKNAPVIIMHNRPSILENVTEEEYLKAIEDDLSISLALAKEAGIKDENIILDSGVGFSKTVKQNLISIREVERLEKFGYPILLGISRKSYIGKTFNLTEDDRLEGTIASNIYGYMHGCSILRVHDVKENKRALDMIYKIME